MTEKGRFFQWSHLSQDVCSALLRTTSATETREILAKALDTKARYAHIAEDLVVVEDDDVHESKSSAAVQRQVEHSLECRQEVFLEMVMSVVAFARSLGFGALPTSTLVSIVIATHEWSCERPVPPPPLTECFAYFEDLLLKHSVQRPPFSIAVFEAAEVDHISRFVMDSYFQFLSMYQYVFGCTHVLKIAPEYSVARGPNLEKSCWPLDAAVTYESLAHLVKPGDDKSQLHALIQNSEGKGEEALSVLGVLPDPSLIERLKLRDASAHGSSSRGGSSTGGGGGGGTGLRLR